MLRRQSQTDQLVMILFRILSIWLDESPVDRKQTALGLLLDHQAESVMELCRIHQSLTKNNHLGFLWKHFRGHRVVLFSIIEELRFIAQVLFSDQRPGSEEDDHSRAAYWSVLVCEPKTAPTSNDAKRSDAVTSVIAHE